MLSIISFSDAGEALSAEIKKKYRHCKTYRKVPDLKAFVAECFQMHRPILFVGACGIAVRSIAPFVESKMTDSAVLVVDEKGKYVIPILSGHVGGANTLACEIAALIGAEPVITTATDVNQKFAVDVFATRNGLAIQNPKGIEKVSLKILKGETVTLGIEGLSAGESKELTGECPGELCFVDWQSNPEICISEKEPVHAVLWLKPKKYILGMGCKRGKTFRQLLDFVTEQLEKQQIDTTEILALSSIDLKQDEEGLLELADYFRVPFLTYTKEQLQGVPGELEHSDFVEAQVGVGNVCERAALCGCGEGGRLLVTKTASEGMTLAIAGRDWRRKIGK